MIDISPSFEERKSVLFCACSTWDLYQTRCDKSTRRALKPGRHCPVDWKSDKLQFVEHRRYDDKQKFVGLSIKGTAFRRFWL